MATNKELQNEIKQLQGLIDRQRMTIEGLNERINNFRTRSEQQQKLISVYERHANILENIAYKMPNTL